MSQRDESVSAYAGVGGSDTAACPAVGDASDDTIELALSEEEVLALSRAAEEDRPGVSLGKSALSAAGAFLRYWRMRSRRWPAVVAGSALVIVVGVALAVVVADRISTVPPGAAPPATPSAESPDLHVRFGNPFDAAEVFEFPPGTSVDQARDSVAALLLQRARARQRAGLIESHRPTPGGAADRARMARNSEPGAVSGLR